MDLLRSLMQVNWGAYYFFNFQRGKNLPVLDQLMVAGDWLGSTPLLAGLTMLAALLLILKRQIRWAILVVAGFGVAVALIFGLQQLVPSHRPPQNGLPSSEAMKSFPATAVLLGFVTLLNLGLALERWTALPRVWRDAALVAVALWITVSQLYFCRNFLTDVLAGMSAGIALALLCRGLAAPRHLPQISTPAPRTDHGQLATEN